MTTTTSTPPTASRAFGTTLVAATVALGLHHAGRFGLAAPARLQPGQIVEWSNDVGAAVAAMTILRLAGIAASLYVVCVGVLVMVASLRPSVRTIRIARGVTPRMLRRTLGLGALTALSLPAGMTAARTPPEAPPVMVLIDAPAAPSTTIPPVQTTLPEPPSPAPQPATTTSTWVVRPGDHFWSIAAATLRERNPAATDTDVANYWRALVDANRDRLVVPGNPDLVFTGQDLVLPPIDNQG